MTSTDLRHGAHTRKLVPPSDSGSAPAGYRLLKRCPPQGSVSNCEGSPDRYEVRFFEIVSEFARPEDYMDPAPKGKVLLVEDDNQVRSFIRMLLTSNGYEVLEASAGAEGLEIAERDSPQ